MYLVGVVVGALAVCRRRIAAVILTRGPVFEGSFSLRPSLKAWTLRSNALQPRRDTEARIASRMKAARLRPTSSVPETINVEPRVDLKKLHTEQLSCTDLQNKTTEKKKKASDFCCTWFPP